jgi:2OG-Fe(II) oxygenase superfamily
MPVNEAMVRAYWTIGGLLERHVGGVDRNGREAVAARSMGRSARSAGWATVDPMIDDPRRVLSDVLRDLRGGGSFSTRRTAPLGDLSIEVRNVGPLRLPIAAAQAKQLRLVARPARYGNGTETLLDRRVRDTWEVPTSRVRIDNRRWTNTLRPLLDLVRDDLGLPSTSSLDAELHSVLVYEPGQFFAAHQDSEKDDRMIGSLVVLLPSRSTGGALVVSHRGETVTYRGSATALTFIAFYADTRHEVLPVESGYRVALTYNLCLANSSTTGAVPRERSTVVASLLAQHFETPVAPRWRHDSEAGETPDRLVFLLDHQYSEHSLRWPQLKGEDATRAVVLRAAAEQADCEVALALAEIQETWDVEYDDYAPRRGRRGWSEWAGPDPDDIEALGSLIDSSIEIQPVDGRPIGGCHVADAELATATPNVDLDPYDTEYTGNMGNYGNTMDRWYRRAAVVIWPRSRAFALRAKGDPAGALDELLALGDDEPDHVATRAEMTAALLRFWPDGVRSSDQRTLLPAALVAAGRLDDAELAGRLLDPFVLEAFHPRDAPDLVVAVGRYGSSWLNERLASWMNQRWNARSDGLPKRSEWVETLPTFCDRLLAGEGSQGRAGVNRETASIIVNAAWGWLRRTVETSSRITRPSDRRSTLVSLGPSLLAMLHACTAIEAAAVCAEVVATACAPDVDLNPLLVATIDASAGVPSSQLARIGLRPLATHCADLLRRELAHPERGDDDWSIGFHQPEHCPDCAELAGFLHDPGRKQMVWPLAKPRREHIHQRIDEAELPVTHQTRREGSPHKLVLTKTAELFTGDAARRIAARSSLDSIETFLDQPDTADA